MSMKVILLVLIADVAEVEISFSVAYKGLKITHLSCTIFRGLKNQLQFKCHVWMPF